MQVVIIGQPRKWPSLTDVLENIGAFGIVFDPDGAPARPKDEKVPFKKKVYDIYVGISPQDYSLVFLVKGLRYDGDSFSVKLGKHDRRHPEQYKNTICLNTKTDEFE